METYAELLRRTERALAAAGIEDARYEARVLAAEAAGHDVSWLLSRRSDPVGWTPEQTARFERMLARRFCREPLQYILGVWEFYGRSFRVGPGVLIPRADTETVVEEAMSLCGRLPAPTAADLCAGSGCIGITLALERGLRLTEVELDETAASYLAANIAALAPGVSLVRADVLDPARLAALPRVGMVVSNPPYIPSADVAGLSAEVRQEPGLALDGGEDGLRFYRAISENAPLLPGGWLVYEVGAGQAEDVRRIMERNGYGSIHIRRDANGIPRAVSGQAQ